MIKKFLLLTLFSISFAYVESTIVVYLRGIYYPQGFEFPFKLISERHLIIEIGREFMTMVMLFTVALIAMGKEKGFKNFTSFFIYSFGIWDIFYYVWLKVFLNWPESFFTWDVLFLIPVVWTGPVLSPVLVSIAMITAALLWQSLKGEEAKRYPARGDYAAIIFFCVLILITYMDKTGEFLKDFRLLKEGAEPCFVPKKYNWTLFMIAYIGGFIFILRPTISRLIKILRHK